jgi:hypothetical protein
LLTATAKEAGIIDVIHAYERKSSVTIRVKEVIQNPDTQDGYGNISPTCLQQGVFDACASFDRKFRLLLRAGIEDAYIILLLVILPNLADMFLHEARSCHTSLDWSLPNHGFKSLRRIVVAFEDGRSTMSFNYLNTVLASPNLKALAVQSDFDWTEETELWQ